jgi:hypothetical protein
VAYGGQSFTVYMKLVRLESNSYIQNYPSGKKGIVSIRGLRFVELLKESFKDNGDSHDEILSIIQ